MNTNPVGVLADSRRDRSVGSLRDHVFPFSHDHEAVGGLRHDTAAVLDAWHVAPTAAEHVLLVVSELATNAIVHALAPATLRLSLIEVAGQPCVRVEVTDHGPRPVRELGDQFPDEHGRGTMIIEAVSACHGRLETVDGSICWADMVA